MAGFLDDDSGNHSSKRLCGCIGFGLALLMYAALFVFSLYHPVGDPETARYVPTKLAEICAVLLGIGVLEGIGSKIGAAFSKKEPESNQ